MKQKKTTYEGASIVCQHCLHDAKFVDWRPKTVQGICGKVVVHRAYYYCSHCHHGSFPGDQLFGLRDQKLTHAARRLVASAGVADPFGKAGDLLKELSGIELSESTVLRATEAVGNELKSQQQNGDSLGEVETWTWSHDAHGKRVGYLSLDGVSVRQQGPQGEQKESRMAYTARVYTGPSDETKQFGKRDKTQEKSMFFSGLMSLDEVAGLMQQGAIDVGGGQVEQWVCLSDGGSGLENCLRNIFPFSECILDFWHAKEYLVELAKKWFGEDEFQRKKWLDESCHDLKYQGGKVIRQRLEKMEVSGRDAATQELHQKTLGYYRNHEHKMDYPSYLANGWQIGSGPVESACKYVVKERLGRSGMRWSETGSDVMCRLRALWLSPKDHWETFWSIAI